MSLIKKEIFEQVTVRLKEIQEREQVKILFACESGSRAWGFPSKDSDYDIRFIYIKKIEHYLSIDETQDVIEENFENDFDLSGWDIKKTLKLFKKSNPQLIEWLYSPIVYLKDEIFYNDLLKLLDIYFSPKSCMYHYLSMAENNIRAYLNGEQVVRKKYFYALRPILACKWIENNYGPVPTEFQKMVDNLIEDKILKEKIENLIIEKMSGAEFSLGNKIPEISDFIEQEFNRLKNSNFYFTKKEYDSQHLNLLFRNTLQRVWNS